ncbi:MAG TPA: terpene cyclase/mutase family protein [Gemmatales bacterium]|nr:terpene cyclase/mutase family protein [Gemmatales bacterium]HMP59647.1 terpene cyclase/mutase family protein [Gemmatales bacterium]
MLPCRGPVILSILATLMLACPGEPVHAGPQGGGELRDRIRAAIAKGVQYLRGQQQADGLWRHQGGGAPGQNDVGATALAGLALLENGVDRKDPAIVAAVGLVRDAVPRLTQTYNISAAIWFLDRAAPAENKAVIRQLANLLLQGQIKETGGWSYDCVPRGHAADNSNTHFALLGLFIARRHQAPVDAALKLVEQRFRTSQNQENGGWSYWAEMPQRASGSMTCVGLMALATGLHVAKVREARFESRGAGSVTTVEPGSRVDISALQRDPAVLRAQEFLAEEVRSAGTSTGHLTYFLWSVERVCFIYGWNKIGKLDWYAHGAEILLKYQEREGSWHLEERQGRVVDTAFALLFLGRSNLVPELEAKFRGEGVEEREQPGAGAPPRPPLPGQARDFVRELPGSSEPRTTELLDALVAAEGVWANDALLQVIRGLETKPTVKIKAREALARRLAAAGAEVLLGALRSGEVELRQAACRAAELKHRGGQDAQPLLTPLVAALHDEEPRVAQAAHAALKAISGQDFGVRPEGWQRWLDRRPR